MAIPSANRNSAVPALPDQCGLPRLTEAKRPFPQLGSNRAGTRRRCGGTSGCPGWKPVDGSCQSAGTRAPTGLANPVRDRRI